MKKAILLVMDLIKDSILLVQIVRSQGGLQQMMMIPYIKQVIVEKGAQTGLYSQL